MLPLLRVLPVGSLLLSALILMLAATPPRRPVLPHLAGAARGPLIDAAEHPEWRQFYLQAAFARVAEMDRLRDLPSTPTRIPPATPDKPAVEAVPAQDVAAVVAPVEPALEKRNEPPVAAVQKEIAAEASPSDVTPSGPLAGNQPPPLPVAPPQQIAGLPAEQAATESEDITGALDSPAVAATMPMDIGEMSSTELPLVLLPERPSRLPVPRPKASSRAKAQHAVTRQSKARRPARPAKRPLAAQQQAQPAATLNLFRSQFGAGGQ